MRHVRDLRVGGLELVEVPDGRASAALADLRDADGVRWAQADPTAHAFGAVADPYLPLEWGLAAIGAPAAWAVADGRGTTVGVVDTGVDAAHPDLAGQLDPRGPRHRPERPRDARGGGRRGGHLQRRRRRRRGPGARVLALQALGADGSGPMSAVADAEDRAADLGARVINLSLGSDGPSLAERAVIRAHPGVLFVAAAGNQSRDDDARPTYPCAYDEPNVLCVGAEARAGGLASFSNWGARSVDLLAPGEHIASTWTGGAYRYADGTSMAALRRGRRGRPARPRPGAQPRRSCGRSSSARAARTRPRPAAWPAATSTSGARWPPPSPRPPRRARGRARDPRAARRHDRRGPAAARPGPGAQRRPPARQPGAQAAPAAATAAASSRAAPRRGRPRARGAARAASRCAGAWRAGPRSASRSSAAPAAPAGAAGPSCAASAPTRRRARPPAAWAPRRGAARSPAGATACASPRSAPRAGRAPSASWADATTLGAWATSTRTRTTTPGTTTPRTTAPGTTTPSRPRTTGAGCSGRSGSSWPSWPWRSSRACSPSSLALLSDAAHMLTDAAAIGLAVVAAAARRPAGRAGASRSGSGGPRSSRRRPTASRCSCSPA